MNSLNSCKKAKTLQRKKGGKNMDIIECVKKRQSVRGYKPDPVPREIIREILEIAVRAPSAMNTQPWEFTVIAGDVLNNIRMANAGAALAMGKNVAVHDRASYRDVYRQRQVELAKEIFRIMDIPRGDLAKRNEWMLRGFRYFDAPAAIIVSADRQLEGTWSMFDLGCVTQTICLVAMKYGLGTCIEDQGAQYGEGIRKYAGIPESKDIIISIAIGYPDWGFPANEMKTPRIPVDEITAWRGFNS
jgi:nitroreductase